jgi:hypothetical protein
MEKSLFILLVYLSESYIIRRMGRNIISDGQKMGI